MAGALSGHVIESYYTLKSSQSSGPFGMAMHSTFNNANPNFWPSNSSDIVTSGAMSFDPNMHGNARPMTMAADLPEDQTSFMNLSKSTSVKIAALQAKLNQQLGPEYISTRPGPGGGPKLVYAEGWKIINLANEVFGFNGWSSNLVSLTTDFIDYNEETRRYSVGVTAIMRVTLRDGVFHEDIGYGILENSKTKGPALDKCKKEAVTDALKRTLRNFGNLLGNCLYDKQYTNEIVKVKVSPPKFDKENLHRRPEYSVDNGTSPAVNASGSDLKTSTSTTPSTKTNLQAPVVKSEPGPPKPISSIPPHVREQVRPSAQESSTLTTPANLSPANLSPANLSKAKTASAKPDILPSNVSTPTAAPPNRGSAMRHAAILHGLNTPMTTPLAPQTKPQPISPQAAQVSSNLRQVTFADSPLATKVLNKPPPHAPPDDYADYGGSGDDSFALGSEDDAFFASVDLGDAADLGRPIDFTEGIDKSEVEGQVTRHMPTVGTRTNGQPARLNAASASSTASNLTKSSSTVANLPLHSHIPNQTDQPSFHQAQRSAPNANTTRGSLEETTNIVATSTPAPPRMGGFSFPPEMLNRQPQQGIGVKRSADVMRASSTAVQTPRDRRLVPGMGLMTAQGGGATRQQFSSKQGLGINREDGGDAKRMRH
ncbi:hypothetical protein EV361DRAFT_922665 [Lentinula raphanica]|nr:hypothetical protein EV361DRAFT_922665 [Lentinula raphanica]